MARLTPITHPPAMASLIDRYHNMIAGVLSCWDRVVIRGTLPGLCYADGMTSYLTAQHIRIFDYPRFAEPLRDVVRANAEKLAAKAGIRLRCHHAHGCPRGEGRASGDLPRT